MGAKTYALCLVVDGKPRTFKGEADSVFAAIRRAHDKCLELGLVPTSIVSAKSVNADGIEATIW